MHPGTSHERYAGFRNPIDQMTAPTPSTNPEASNESGACRATQITVAAARGRKSRPILNPVTKLNVINAPAADHAPNQRQAPFACGLRETMIAATSNTRGYSSAIRLAQEGRDAATKRARRRSGEERRQS